MIVMGRGLMLIWIYVNNIACAQVNVALDKKASTTTGIFGGVWHPSGAVDGDHVTLDSATSCFHSATSPAEWTVDLGQKYQLSDIIVYLRSGWLYRTENSIIYVDNNQTRVCFTFPSNISDNPTHLTCNETARYITIRNPGERLDYGDTLNICEVEIYACTNGSYGTDCELDCQCSSCDRWSGICYGGCKHVCYAGHYGEDCASECVARHCSDDSSCDSTTGRCDGGCQAGWTGVDCVVCASTNYGEDCASECSARRCEGDSSCDSTGGCDGGCQMGWTGVDCTNPDDIVGASSNTAVILSAAALTTGGVLVIVFIIIGVFMWTKRRKNLDKPSQNSSMILSTISQHGDHIGTDENNVYTSPDRVEITPPAPYETLKVENKGPKYMKTNI